MKIITEMAQWRKMIHEETLSRWSDNILLLDTNELKRTQTDENCVAIVDKFSTAAVMDIVATTNVKHVIQVSNPKFDHAANLSAALIQQPEHFFSSPAEIFFLHRQKEIPKYASESFSVRNSRDKISVLNVIETYLKDIDKISPILNNILSIADELYTNAVFNAPVDDMGKPKFAKMARSLPLEIDYNHEAKITVAHSEQLLFIYCEDSYGSLVPNKVIKRIDYCHKNGVSSSMNIKSYGGTGIGCYMMFEQCNSFFMTVQPGKKTIVGAALLLGLPGRLIAEIPKNIHIIDTHNST
ncbi:MAG: hypothetical protein A2Z20_11885 [Bdellovibrionales bacterium RBG_16_40_8]|nr:MAG: hypothetical protein A2Z20_11885 [Bdellovibrionales bacterium RBG_16_40_8]